MKVLSVLCGIGLAFLWLVGIENPTAASWLTWLDAVSAVLSFVVAATIRSNFPRGGDVVGTILLSAGLFVLWMIGMTTHSPSWQNWGTFGFACGMAIVASALANQRAKEPEERINGKASAFKEIQRQRSA